MAIHVHKFGGSSLATVELIEACARRIASVVAEGEQVVVVVSAMGDSTDDLVALAERISPEPAPREMDLVLASGEQVSCALMSLALQRLGLPSVALLGGQAGIETERRHGRARIRRVNPSRIRAELERGRVPVIAGFQGVTPDGEVTTIGRGGSDTTAVALAAALGVNERCGSCQIHTDVDGVHTADPRVVPGAPRLERIAYEEMLELALLGAQVMHGRAVLYGEKYGVPIHVRHARRPGPGTLITKESPEMEQASVVGCAIKRDLGRVTVRGIANEPGVQAALFEAVAREGLLVDDIMQTEDAERANLSFTVDHADLVEVRAAVDAAVRLLGGGDVSVEIGLAKVSVVGAGMKSHTGVASTMFRALAEEKVPIRNITTSEIKISCLVPKQQAEQALRAVHAAFGLGESARGVLVETEGDDVVR